MRRRRLAICARCNSLFQNVELKARGELSFRRRVPVLQAPKAFRELDMPSPW